MTAGAPPVAWLPGRRSDLGSQKKTAKECLELEIEAFPARTATALNRGLPVGPLGGGWFWSIFLGKKYVPFLENLKERLDRI